MTRRGAYRRKSEIVRPGPVFTRCESCLGGWVTTWRNTRGEGFVPLPTVTRCSCWLAHQQALEARGDSEPAADAKP